MRLYESEASEMEEDITAALDDTFRGGNIETTSMGGDEFMVEIEGQLADITIQDTGDLEGDIRDAVGPFLDYAIDIEVDVLDPEATDVLVTMFGDYGSFIDAADEILVIESCY